MPNWSETSAPHERSSFWRLAGDSGSAATMILRTEEAARSMPLRFRQIGKVNPVARHAGPDRGLELADQLELRSARAVLLPEPHQIVPMPRSSAARA